MAKRPRWSAFRDSGRSASTISRHRSSSTPMSTPTLTEFIRRRGRGPVVKHDFFASYRRSPSILDTHIESEGNKGNEGNMPGRLNEIKDNSVSLLAVAVSLDAEQGLTGETQISSQ